VRGDRDALRLSGERLIRTADDRGVVAVLDPRLATTSYRGVLLATLPPMRQTVEFSEVEAFLLEALPSSLVGP
jgi:ATP-dependent DNA helicase DinG